MRISDWSSDVCSSDLQKGIAGLSVLNTWLFFAIIAFVLVAGPLGDIIGLSLSGGVDYVRTFVPRNLGLDVDAGWHRQWTVFNWANWFAWAPVTALFLGRLDRKSVGEGKSVSVRVDLGGRR